MRIAKAEKIKALDKAIDRIQIVLDAESAYMSIECPLCALVTGEYGKKDCKECPIARSDVCTIHIRELSEGFIAAQAIQMTLKRAKAEL